MIAGRPLRRTDLRSPGLLADWTVARRAAVAALLVGVMLAAMWNWSHPTLRLTSVVANRVALVLMLLLPWPAVGIVWPTLRGWRRIAYVAAMAPLLLVGSCNALLIATFDLPDVIHDGRDINFKPIRRVALDRSVLVLYRTDCGATCDWGLVLRQERRIAPGLLLVRELGSWYHAYDAQMERTAADQWRLRIARPGDSTTTKDTVVRVPISDRVRGGRSIDVLAIATLVPHG